jgi:hypothetical protein
MVVNSASNSEVQSDNIEDNKALSQNSLQTPVSTNENYEQS